MKVLLLKPVKIFTPKNAKNPKIEIIIQVKAVGVFYHGDPCYASSEAFAGDLQVHFAGHIIYPAPVELTKTLFYDNEALTKDKNDLGEQILTYRQQIKIFGEQTETFKDQSETYKKQTEIFKKQTEIFGEQAETFKKENEALKQELTETQEKYETMSEKMTSMLNSHSWRLTAPLRYLLNLCGRRGD